MSIFIIGITLAVALLIIGEVYLITNKKQSLKWHEYFRKSYWLVYTIGFFCIGLFVIQWFILCKKSFVWNSDGLNQHILSLVYYSDWLRTIAKNLIHEHTLSVPLWDMRIGQGSDIITTLNYYVLGDPLNLLAVFVRPEKIETLYTALIFLRVYLVGASFSVFARYHRYGRKVSLIASYMYCFSIFAFSLAAVHPYFINPMIYLPLILLGIDKIYKKEKPYVFIISTAVAAISNFYFCYMLAVFAILYTVLRYKDAVGELRFKELCCWIGKFLLYGVTAAMLASVIFLPVVMFALNTNRMGANNYIPFLFNTEYYESLLATVISGKEAGHYNRLGVAAPGMLAVFLLFSKKGEKSLKIGISLMFIASCIPYLGHVLHGFSYVSYRCSFMFAFLLCYTFLKMYPHFLHMTAVEKKRMTCMVIVYIGLFLLSEGARSERAFCMLSILVTCLFLLFRQKENIEDDIFQSNVLVGTVIVCICFSAYYRFSPKQGNVIAEFVEQNTAVASLSSQYDRNENKDFFNSGDLIRDWDRNGELVRAEIWGGTETTANTAMLQDYYGIGYYFSLINPYVAQFNKEVANVTVLEYRTRDLDCRGFLEALADTKYFVARTPINEKLNINASLFRNNFLAEKNNFGLYEADDYMGLVYGYDAYIDRADYEGLNPAQRQETLMKSIMLENDAQVSGFDKAIPNLLTEARGYEVEMDGVIPDGNTFHVMKKDATITLHYEGMSNSENYILIEGLDFHRKSPWERWPEEERAALTPYDRNRLIKDTMYYTPPKEAKLAIQTSFGKGNKGFTYGNNSYNFYCGIHDYMFNMGYSDEPENSMTLIFKSVGDYTMNAVSIFCQPMDELNSLIEERKVEGGRNFIIGTNTYDGTVTLDKKKLLCLAIPYSKGWKAYVDGKETPLMQANTMYMALNLEEGTHEIHLEYMTPYLKTGILLSLMGCMLCIGFMVTDGIKMKKRS